MLNQNDRDRVREAVIRAEAGLAAEIVPCVFAQSSPYPEAAWAGGAAAGGLACAALFLTDLVHPLWLPLSILILLVPAVALAGAALGHWFRPVKRFLIGSRRMEESAARRAKEVFFDHGVARTKARDGVLVFASLLERRAIVLADESLRAKMGPEKWRPAVSALAAAADDGRVADGLIAAIEAVAEALRAAGAVGKGGGELPVDALEEDAR